MKRYYAIIGIAVAIVLCLTTVSFAGSSTSKGGMVVSMEPFKVTPGYPQVPTGRRYPTRQHVFLNLRTGQTSPFRGPGSHWVAVHRDYGAYIGALHSFLNKQGIRWDPRRKMWARSAGPGHWGEEVPREEVNALLRSFISEWWAKKEKYGDREPRARERKIGGFPGLVAIRARAAAGAGGIPPGGVPGANYSPEIQAWLAAGAHFSKTGQLQYSGAQMTRDIWERYVGKPAGRMTAAPPLVPHMGGRPDRHGSPWGRIER